jgi:hypothetical protein
MVFTKAHHWTLYWARVLNILLIKILFTEKTIILEYGWTETTSVLECLSRLARGPIYNDVKWEQIMKLTPILILEVWN